MGYSAFGLTEHAVVFLPHCELCWNVDAFLYLKTRFKGFF